MEGNTTDTASVTAGTEEPRIVAVTCLKDRTKIDKAICAAGPVDFPLTKSEAEALRDLGLVTITGIFATTPKA